MKENTKKRNLFSTILICMLVIVSFGFWQRDNNVNENNAHLQNENIKISPTQLSTAADASEITTPTDYTLLLKNDVLNFYLNSEKETLLLEAIPINTELFPPEDIKELSKGITVKTLEECVNIIEDFTS